jgi:hypothetical protein
MELWRGVRPSVFPLQPRFLSSRTAFFSIAVASRIKGDARPFNTRDTRYPVRN